MPEWAKGRLTEITRFAMKPNATDLISTCRGKLSVLENRNAGFVPRFYWATTSQAHALLQASTKESEPGAQ